MNALFTPLDVDLHPHTKIAAVTAHIAARFAFG
jgi:hypothetical protein